MSIQKRVVGGKTRYRVRWLEGERHRSKQFDKLKPAQLFEAQIRKDVQEGVSRVDPKMTVSQLADLWWSKHVEPECQQRTKVYYELQLKLRIRPLLGHVRCVAVDRERIAEFRKDMLKAGHSPDAANKSLATLKAMFEKGVEWGRVRDNPLRRVKKVAHQRGKKRAFTPEQAWAIVQSMPSHRDEVMALTMYFAGLRISELLALRWSDIRDDRIIVAQARDVDGTLKHTKATEEGHVFLFGPLAAALEQWRDDPGWRNKEWRGSDLVFQRDRGGMLDPHNWRREAWRPAVAKAAEREPAVAGATPHELRHSFGAYTILRGANAQQAKRLMRHSTIAMTMDTYGHDFEGSLVGVDAAITAEHRLLTKGTGGLSVTPDAPALLGAQIVLHSA